MYGLTGCARSADHDISKPEEQRATYRGQRPNCAGHIPSGLARAMRCENALLTHQNPPVSLVVAPRTAIRSTLSAKNFPRYRLRHRHVSDARSQLPGVRVAGGRTTGAQIGKSFTKCASRWGVTGGQSTAGAASIILTRGAGNAKFSDY